MKTSKLEEMFASHLKALRCPEPVREHGFHPSRRWKFDFAWDIDDHRIAAECEGGTWNRGRHVRPKTFALDCEKYNEAARLGWIVFRFTSEQIHSGDAALFMYHYFRQLKKETNVWPIKSQLRSRRRAAE